MIFYLCITTVLGCAQKLARPSRIGWWCFGTRSFKFCAGIPHRGAVLDTHFLYVNTNKHFLFPVDFAAALQQSETGGRLPHCLNSTEPVQEV